MGEIYPQKLKDEVNYCYGEFKIENGNVSASQSVDAKGSAIDAQVRKLLSEHAEFLTRGNRNFGVEDALIVFAKEDAGGHKKVTRILSGKASVEPRSGTPVFIATRSINVRPETVQRAEFQDRQIRQMDLTNDRKVMRDSASFLHRYVEQTIANTESGQQKPVIVAGGDVQEGHPTATGLPATLRGNLKGLM